MTEPIAAPKECPTCHAFPHAESCPLKAAAAAFGRMGAIAYWSRMDATQRGEEIARRWKKRARKPKRRKRMKES